MQRFAGVFITTEKARWRHARAGAIVHHYLVTLGHGAPPHLLNIVIQSGIALVVEPLKLPPYQGVAGGVDVLATPFGAATAQPAP